MTDEIGASSTANVTITITGSNDGPVMTGGGSGVGHGSRDGETATGTIDFATSICDAVTSMPGGGDTGTFVADVAETQPATAAGR